MVEFFAVLGQAWYALVFAAIIMVVAVLSNAGVLRTAVHAAHPGSAWGAIIVGIPFLVLPVVGATYRALLVDTGVAHPWLMYSAIALLLVSVALGAYLIFATRPPRAFVPAWLRKS